MWTLLEIINSMLEHSSSEKYIPVFHIDWEDVWKHPYWIDGYNFALTEIKEIIESEFERELIEWAERVSKKPISDFISI